MAKFTVDTHLFRELGALLVGRDSTALIELIKNSYDADATQVTVHGEQLDDPARGRIIVTDDGRGMTAAQFERGFLRIASRLKDQEQRRSVIYHRRYTGAKGIGRLAAHKLASLLQVDSVSAGDEGSQREAIHAVIDWNKIEEYETLDDLNAADAVFVQRRTARENAEPGTTLTLTGLRRAWTPVERARFFSEVQSFDPPSFLEEPLPPSILDEPVLFTTPVVRDSDPGIAATRGQFRVSLEGDFAAGEEYWQLLATAASWVLEIRAAQDNGSIHIGVAPTNRTRDQNPNAERFQVTVPHPDPQNGPFFDARILVREGKLSGRRDERVWAANSSGVRVYLEGFRVLPYGEPKDDWLSIDHDYTRRPRQLQLFPSLDLQEDAVDPDIGLVRLPNNNYFGAVFLTLERAPSLRMLVNREGFVPEGGYDTLVDAIRTGIDLTTRVRAAAGFARRQARRKGRSAKGGDGTSDEPEAQERESEDEDPSRLPGRLHEASELVRQARAHAVGGRLKEAQEAAGAAVSRLAEAEGLAAGVISERELLRVLASVGTQMAAFVHEINSLLGTAQTLERALEGFLDDEITPKSQRKRIRETMNAAAELRRGLERQASYLMDVVTPDARRRRARQRLKDRFDGAVRLVAHQAERRRIEITNAIPATLKSVPMFPAELTTAFANLLTNAVKAAGEGGRIHAQASQRDGRVVLRIENTGARVVLDEAERWFRPFESTTSDVDPVLGQGMGLGLTITRNVMESYGVELRFVEPTEDYSTAIELTFPK